MGQILGLRRAIYGVANITEATVWYTQLLEQPPYYESDSYVGFRLGDCELGLDSDARSAISRADGVIAYWQVLDLAAQVERLGAMGVRQHSDIEDGGKGALKASFLDPDGNIFGLIECPQVLPEM
ncbi:VOC family protein [Microbulbifer sp. OS29]|uniref:VOC family protein n=1 Tax=Microbulbifer okhotskensis TaxID=2926617 RepID=A0A9X2ERX8_9GAMM|nr:VOC family protein [Microbulbifer okhotskensis]MCO1334628.1 VOC family protein [Microbulbifer okhotskensis]